MSLSTTFLCNICGDDFTDMSKKVILKCNPHHIYCYDCIYDWYLKCSTSSNSSENKPHSCPICKKDGGFLNTVPNKPNIYNVHYGNSTTNYSSQPYNHNSGEICKCQNLAGNGTKYTCTYNASNTVLINNKVNGNIVQSYLHVCWKHKGLYDKGFDLDHLDNGVIESIYKSVKCCVLHKNGKECNGESNIYKNGHYITILKNDKEYNVCNKHKTQYNNNYTLHIKNGETISKNDFDPHLCNTLMKNGKLCTKSGNEKYGGKCSTHKNDILKEKSLKNDDSNTLFNEMEETFKELKNLFQIMKNKQSLIENKLNEISFSEKIDSLQSILQNIEENLLLLSFENNNQTISDNIKNYIQDFINVLNKLHIDNDSNIISDKDDIEEDIKEEDNKNNDYSYFDMLSSQTKDKKTKPIKNDKKITENEIKVVDTIPFSPYNKKPTFFIHNDIKKAMITFDLYEPNLDIDPHCNVKLQNGKLCCQRGNIYYNLKCGKHSSKIYVKEKLFR